MILRALAMVFVALSFAPAALAQSVTVSMVADRGQVEVGGMVRLTVRAEMTGDTQAQVQLPDLSAFDVVQRQVSRPFTLRLGTGQGTHVQSTETHSLVLRARTPGTVTIAPATVMLGGRRYQSEPVTIVVGDGPAQPGQPSGPQPAPGPAQGLPPAGAVDGMAFDQDAFVRTWVDDGEPYLGQQVTVTIYLYTRQPLRGSPAITQEASTDGFWVQDLLQRNQALQAERQRLSGIDFYVYRLRRFAAFPLRTGELSIGATTIEVTQNSIFDLLGGGGGPPVWRRSGVPVTVNVRELPEDGRPRGEVHVGALELSAELDRTQVQTGDAVTLTLTARGRGSMDQLQLPAPRGDGLRVLQPEIRDQVSSPGDIVGGTRIARWLIVPEREGTFRLGPFEVPTFDPATEQYGVARVDALSLTAAGRAPDAPADSAAEPDEAPELEGEAPTFRPIHTRAALARSHGSWTEAPWFLALFGLGPLALLGALFVRRARARAGREDPSQAPKRARRAARRQLGAAERHAAAGEAREFYGAIAQAIKETLEAKLGRPVGSLTHPELRRILAERGMADELADRVVDELEGSDFARFSAVGVSESEMQSCLARSRELVAELERFNPTREEAA